MLRKIVPGVSVSAVIDSNDPIDDHVKVTELGTGPIALESLYIDNDNDIYKVIKPEDIDWLEISKRDLSAGNISNREILNLTGILEARRLLGLDLDIERLAKIYKELGSTPIAKLVQLVQDIL
jgi:hypothetical protein